MGSMLTARVTIGVAAPGSLSAWAVSRAPRFNYGQSTGVRSRGTPSRMRATTVMMKPPTTSEITHDAKWRKQELRRARFEVFTHNAFSGGTGPRGSGCLKSGDGSTSTPAALRAGSLNALRVDPGNGGGV